MGKRATRWVGAGVVRYTLYRATLPRAEEDDCKSHTDLDLAAAGVCSLITAGRTFKSMMQYSRSWVLRRLFCSASCASCSLRATFCSLTRPAWPRYLCGAPASLRPCVGLCSVHTRRLSDGVKRLRVAITAEHALVVVPIARGEVLLEGAHMSEGDAASKSTRARLSIRCYDAERACMEGRWQRTSSLAAPSSTCVGVGHHQPGYGVGR